MNNELFVKVYNQYHRLVIKAALDQTGDLELAKEICQMVFIKYYDNMNTVARSFVKGWLMITTKRIIIDSRRKASIRYEVAMPDSGMNALLDYSIDELIERTSHSQLVYEIFEDLKRVNEVWYETIYEVYINCQPQEIVAARMGVKLTVLRARLYRAKKYIRDKYLEKYQDE